MHYANCSTFNADFDGDEINLHSQDHQASRSAQIVSRGAILRADGWETAGGLIQDHICSAVLLTQRPLSTKKVLAIVCCVPVELCDSENLSIGYRRQLFTNWRRLRTGKDVIRTILAHVAYQRPGDFEHSCKTPHTFSSEDKQE